MAGKFRYECRDKNRETDFEVHAEAYFKLREKYPIVRANYEIYDRKTGENGICDIVIMYKSGKIILVVEVKKNKGVKRRGTQIRRYERLARCPCIYIIGIEQARQADLIIKNFLTKYRSSNGKNTIPET